MIIKYFVWKILIFLIFFQIIILKINWPDGTYGLPEPSTGCPIGWLTGSTYHNTEDEQNNNRRSNFSNHFNGIFNSRGIEQNFCMKLNSTNNSSSIILWPEGKYCIYKKGQCPDKMKQGSIFWDDEKSQQDLPNSNEGSLPDGNYTLTTTLIEFCCSTSGSVYNSIQLPTDVPFYLFPYENKTCQKVYGMNSSIEYIFFDDNDEGNRDSINGSIPYGPRPDRDFNILLYFCYYDPLSFKFN